MYIKKITNKRRGTESKEKKNNWRVGLLFGMACMQIQKEREGRQKKSHFRLNHAKPSYMRPTGRKGRWDESNDAMKVPEQQQDSSACHLKSAERLTRWRVLCKLQQLFLFFLIAYNKKIPKTNQQSQTDHGKITTKPLNARLKN